MTDLSLPWLEISILLPLIGAAVVAFQKDSSVARNWALVFSGLALLCTFLQWQDFWLLQAHEADDPGHLMSLLFKREVLVLDELSAPLVPLVALLYLLTILATLSTKIRRFSFTSALLSEAIVLATFTASADEPWLVIGLLALGTVPPIFELRSRGKPIRIHLLHSILFVGLLVMGEYFIDREAGLAEHSLWAIIPLLLAVLIRSGVFPFHIWITDLFEHASFGTALLFVVPIVGALAAVRLVLPIAPDWVLRSIGMLALGTAVYAAAMSLVQKEARRFFAFLFISHSSLVLVGLELVTPISVTGALCIWLSIGLAMGGFGTTLRALEARRGRLSLRDFQGLYDHAPMLAVCFLLTGLASVGFPGTFGFVGTEILMDGAIQAFPHIGVVLVVVAALNSISVVRVFFLLFTGKRHYSTVSLQLGMHERFAMLFLAGLILLGGLYPQPGVASRHHAAVDLLKTRPAVLHSDDEEDSDDHEHEHDADHAKHSSPSTDKKSDESDKDKD